MVCVQADIKEFMLWMNKALMRLSKIQIYQQDQPMVVPGVLNVFMTVSGVLCLLSKKSLWEWRQSQKAKLKWGFWGCRDASVVENPGLSSRRPTFSPQHAHGILKAVTLVPGIWYPFTSSDTVQRNINADKTPIHVTKHVEREKTGDGNKSITSNTYKEVEVGR